MTAKELNAIRNSVKEKNPLIHSITNPISINQCANVLLSVGAKPMMAEHPKEVSSVTKSADSLMLNLGNITDVRKKSIMISAKTATENGIPFIVDAVGVACLNFRRNYALKLLKKSKPSVIKGNYSEINALFNSAYSSRGIDADLSLTKETVTAASKKLASAYNTVVLATGKTDIITDGNRVIYIKNGTKRLASVTGTGCMLGALCAAFLSAADGFSAAVCAASFLGICGELSDNAKGTGSFMVSLLDNISGLSDDDFDKNLALEEEKNERI